jgi:hypothetical protein
MANMPIISIAEFTGTAKIEASTKPSGDHGDWPE